jgi:hypothetical protein
MNEEAEAAALAAIETEETKTEESPVEQTDDRSYDEIQETKARADNWVPLDDWVDSGKNAEDWVKADVFNVRKGLVGEVRGLKRQLSDYDKRMDNLNQAHAGQMEVQRKELIAARDEAILEGGQHGLEIAKNKQYQIDTMNQGNFVQPQAADPTQTEWESRNQWINEDSPKGAYGRDVWAKLGAAGHTSAATAIPALEAAMAKAFPAQARSKPKQSEAETGSKPTGFKRSGQKLTMADVTSDERKMLDAMPGAWANKSDAEILQAVKDARGVK